jgi:TrmH family RNA methyltransferase
MNKSWQKLIKALHQKKYRQEEGVFLVEGEKSVVELLDSTLVTKAVFFTQNFAVQYSNLLQKAAKNDTELWQVSPTVLEQVGTLQSNDAALAVVELPENKALVCPKNSYQIVLADLRDPGNLGTIIRIADWYGIHQIVCSLSTVDWYNPKVVISSMGSFLRVQPYYCELPAYFEQNAHLPIYGALMNGTNVHTVQFAPRHDCHRQ